MNKKSYTLSKLMNELVAANGIPKTKASVNMALASTSKSQMKGKGEKKKKGTKKAGKQVALEVNKVGNKEANAKQKGTYFNYDELGHLKRNCPKFLTSKIQVAYTSFFVKTCLVVNPMDFWCVDSRSTNMCWNPNLIKSPNPSFRASPED